MFSASVAAKYDLNVAAFLENIKFWTIKNIGNDKNYIDGHYWTYNSRKAFALQFSYFTEKQIRTIISKCLKEGILIKGNYNQNQYDRTNWYALTKKGCELFPDLMVIIAQQNVVIGQPEKVDDLGPNGPMIRPSGANDMAQEGQGTHYLYTYTTTDVTNTYIVQNDKNTVDNFHEHQPKLRSDERVCDNDLDIWFSQFWSAYPKKMSKKPAKQKFFSIVKKQKDQYDFVQMLIKDVKRRLQTEWKGKDKQYIPNAARYINEERWEDEVIPVSNNSSKQSKSKSKEPLNHYRGGWANLPRDEFGNLIREEEGGNIYDAEYTTMGESYGQIVLQADDDETSLQTSD